MGNKVIKKYTLGNNEWFTQKLDIDLISRVLTKQLLATEDNYDNWMIISDEEKEKYEIEKSNLINEKLLSVNGSI